MLIDTHCHLDYLIKKGTALGEILLHADRSDVRKLISISTLVSRFSEDILPIINNTCNSDVKVYCTIGTHPESAGNDNFDLDELSAIIQENRDKIVGMGETGIDLYRNDSPTLTSQIESLEKHIELGLKFDLPIIFHSRSAEEETINVLGKYKGSGLSCVMHCFTGSWELAKFCLDQGFFISISGIVTFKNAEELRSVVRKIPIDRLVIETDSPFLAPAPYRGKDNQPAFVKSTAMFLAQMLQKDYLEFTNQIWENSHKLFPLI